MELSLAAAKEIIAVEKRVVRPMSWAPQLSKSEPKWFQYETAVEDGGGVVLEGVRVICGWGPANHERPETFNVGLVCGRSRIYAIDVKPLGRHKNKTGEGRPQYNKIISGSHEHTWSNDGYGYAEEIGFDGIDDCSVVWALFCKRANISFPHEFVHPDPAKQAGQSETFKW